MEIKLQYLKNKMENKESYTPKEIAEMVSVHLYVSSNLKNLENKMIEVKEGLYARGKKKEADKMWGHLIRNRYEEARKLFEKAYNEAIPENVREAFKSKNILLNLEEKIK